MARDPKKRRRSSYLDFTRVAKPFPNVDTRVLCQLAELVDVHPSKVLDLVPEASATQIGAFMRIAEESINKEMRGGRHKDPKSPRREAPLVAD